MEFALNTIQLPLKSDHLHTNPKCIHFHEDSEGPLIASWDDCVTVLYTLENLGEASLWNPIEPVVSSCICTILVFCFKLKLITNL